MSELLWTETTLGQVLERIEAGASPQAESRPAAPHENGVLKVSAVSWGRFRPTENKALKEAPPKPEAVVRKGDLLISRANTAELVGAVVLVDEDHPNLFLSDKTLRLVTKPTVHKPYLMRALRTKRVRAFFEDQATGTSHSMRNLSQQKIRSAPIRLPSLSEQRRIAEYLETAEARTEAAKHSLDAIPPLLDKFRQSVLAAAFRGDLTKTWREQNPDVEPASVLLARIRTERRRRWEEAHPGKKCREQFGWAQDVEQGQWRMDRLPETWSWATFDDVFTDVTDSRRKLPQSQYSMDGVIPIVDQGSKTIGGYTDRIDLAYMGTLPVIVFGDHTRCVKLLDEPFIQGADGTKVLLPSFSLDARFLYRALQALVIPNKGYSRHMKFVRASRFPVPPLAEQKAIMSRVDLLLAEIAETAPTPTTMLRQLSELESASLSKLLASSTKA